jgi:hypothetical protein
MSDKQPQAEYQPLSLTVVVEPESDAELGAMNGLSQVMDWYAAQPDVTEGDVTRVANWLSARYSYRHIKATED